MKYRKKPIVVEAMQLSFENLKTVSEWCSANCSYYSRTMRAFTGLLINTAEGEMIVNYGDWIIKGIEGEFYPCSDSVFRKTYEAVE